MRYHYPVHRHHRRWFMGRDKVLGLSLAILLIGFAAAFCFRNEPFVESGLKLARAKILDEAIAERPGPKPYTPAAKPQRNKANLPTVTLQGIESVEPFADLQTPSSADRDKASPKEKKNGPAKEATARAEVKPPVETKLAEIGSLTAAVDPGSAPVDTDRSASEINTSKTSTPPGDPTVEGFSPSSQRLTSAEPPADNSSNGENQSAATDIVIRPLSPLGGRADSKVQQDAAWQSTTTERDRGPLADNAPRNDSELDKSAGDDPPRANRARENLSQENPTQENPTRENPTRECPVAEGPNHDNPAAVDPPRQDSRGDDPLSDADGAPKGATHRVRRGDTLTKIALHYLGASSRYREIYEANRDQLHSPNDRLKIGMTLRIPDNTAKPDRPGGSVARRKSRPNRSGHAAAENARTRKVPIRDVVRVRETPPNRPDDNPPASSSDDERKSADPAPTIRFAPVRKTPFLPANKTEPDAPPPPENEEGTTPGTAPDMSHYRFFSRTAPIRIAGDREDAVVR